MDSPPSPASRSLLPLAAIAVAVGYVIYAFNEKPARSPRTSQFRSDRDWVAADLTSSLWKR